MSKEFLTIQEVAEKLRCGHRTVRRMLSEGLIDGYKVRGRVLVDVASLERAVKPIKVTHSTGTGRKRYTA